MYRVVSSLKIAAAGIALLLLYVSRLLGQSSPIPGAPTFRFQDTRLGMSLNEFTAKHPTPLVNRYGQMPPPQPGQAVCSTSSATTTCHFDIRYLGNNLRVITTFVNASLAMIEVEPPYDSPGCFEPPSADAANSEQYFFSNVQGLPAPYSGL